MAFVFLILVFFIDQRGVSDKHCLLSFFSFSAAILLINEMLSVYIGTLIGQKRIRQFRSSEFCSKSLRVTGWSKNAKIA